MAGLKAVLKQITECLIIFLLMVSTIRAGEKSVLFLDGIKDYNEGHYPAAIAKFSEIAGSGIKNGKLFYNLGNAYLKNSDLGYAVLWYKRALKLTPNDPDLKFNYNYALSRIKDITPEKKNPVLKVVFFWKYLLSRTMLQWFGIVLNGVFWIILTVQLIFRTKAFNLVRHAVLILAVVVTMTASYNYYEDIYNRQAIILPSDLSVRSGLWANSTELFVLHAGSQVKIDEEKNGFVKIRFSKNKIGWIKKNEAGVI